MKNKILCRSLIGIIVILFMLGVSFAGDSATISVSCTIPAIPGVNAPPFPVKQDLKNAGNTQEQTQEAKNKESETQKKAETIFIAQELPGNIQIVYSR